MANEISRRHAVDLPCPWFSRHSTPECRESRLELESAATRYTGVIYDIHIDSMTGSYIDFPGHIAQTDDGRRADNVDLADFYRMDATAIHLDRTERPGGITGAELEAACGGIPNTPAIIVHAMGAMEPMDIKFRSVWLTMDAVEWLIAVKCKVLISDAYESPDLEGVFLRLFQAGVVAVCEPYHLHKIPERIELTIGFMKLPATQVPCTLLAEF